MPNEFVARLGIIALQNSQVTGSLSTTCDSIFNGVCVGQGSGAVSSNTRVGASALVSNTTGTNNTAIGTYTLCANTSGTTNTAIGVNSLRNNTASK